MRTVLLLLAVLALPTVACRREESTPTGTKVEPTPPAVTQAWRGEGDRIELSVWGMHCTGCESRLEKSLRAIEGVEDADADRETSVVVVKIERPEERARVIAEIREAVHGHPRANVILGEDAVPE